MSNSNTLTVKYDDIDKEVRSLIAKNADKPRATYSILEELKSKYKDNEIVDSIMHKYNEKMKRVRKLAEKIKERLVSKYPKLSMKEYIQKISDYKKKYNFDESEAQAIINLIFLTNSNFANPEVFDANYNEMSKALGFTPASYNLTGKLHVKKDEVEQLQMILTIASATKELHDQVSLQSLIYTDCDQVAIANAPFEKNKINIFSFIHPVIAALFIPKIELLDQHMILASISKIIAYKQNGQEIQTQPEYELYWDIATDPAETACVNKSRPFTDLVNRCNVQTKLWEAVLNLRQGKYYTNDLSSFLMAIDNCRTNVFDAADFAYVKDEGTVMRKLLSAFSIRPTIVATMPVMGITPLTSHIAPVSTTHITTLSMITMRLPMTLGNKSESIDLREEALSQQQLYIHHRQLTVKRQQILYSREILIFYVHRRYQLFNTARITNPYKISFLPMTMNQFEKLLDIEVDIPLDDLIIPSNSSGSTNQTYRLISVVTVETRPIEPPYKKDDKCDDKCDDNKMGDIIIGCSTLIRNPNHSTNQNYYGWKYNPLNLKSEGSSVAAMATCDEYLFTTEAKRKGTLYVYRTCDKVKDISLLF